MILTSRRQQRVLAAMYGSLRKSDPRLVARFTMFTELTGDAAMPAVERMRHKPLRRLVSGVRALARHRRRAPRRSQHAREVKRDRARWRLGGVVFIPALAAALLAVVMLFAEGQAQGSCQRAPSATSSATTSSAAQNSAAENSAAQSGSRRPSASARAGGTGTACPANQLPVLARGR